MSETTTTTTTTWRGEAASQDDAAWFRRYPKRAFRLRFAAELEEQELRDVAAQQGKHLPGGSVMVIVVRQLVPGVRCRMPGLVFDIGEPFELPASEAAAEALFNDWRCGLSRRRDGTLVLQPWGMAG